MEIRDIDKCRIITLFSPKLSERETNRLKEEIELGKGKRIGIDMSYVNDCTIHFINELHMIKDIALFNIQSDIFAILTNMGMDKSLNLFVSEIDFVDNKHQLLNRKFSVIQ